MSNLASSSSSFSPSSYSNRSANVITNLHLYEITIDKFFLDYCTMVATLKSSFLSNVGTSFKRKSMYARTRDKANKLVANVVDESGTSREPAGFDLSQRRKKGKTSIPR